MIQKGRKQVQCSFCSKSLDRQIWNYGKQRPIMEFFCDNSCKGAWQKQQREALGFTREWLSEEYIVKRKSTNQIAREIGRDSKRVWEWIRDYGLDTRPRGTDYGQGFKPGQEGAFKGRKHTQEARENFRRMRIADGRVPYLKNGKHWLRQDGARHPSWKGGVTPERQALYASGEWREAVKAVWARDRARCQKCGIPHNTPKSRGTFHVHHVVSFAERRLRASVPNLVLLCATCHRFVHSRKNTAGEFIRPRIAEEACKNLAAEEKKANQDTLFPVTWTNSEEEANDAVEA